MSKTEKSKHIFDLEIRTLNFTKNVIKLCKQLNRNPVNNPLISQLMRAAGSVGANYREANDALSKKDFVHRLKIARKEAKETLYWLELVEEANLEFGQDIKKLLQESLELKKILSAIIEKSTKN